MRRLTLLGVLGLVVLPMQAAAQIVADPTSPPLDNAYCGGALTPFNPNDWDGEIPAWSGSGRPMARVDLAGNCNDGSPAAMYVRPAPALLPTGEPNPYQKMVHIHFKGGGSCRSFEECRQRFCARGNKATNKPGLMSSRGWTDLAEGTGLFDDRPGNRFAYANQVLLGYCSSDTWIGSAPAGTAVSNAIGDDPAAVSRITFQGEIITNAALAARGGGVAWPVPPLDLEYEMPELTGMSHILITGDSGGANGARHHLDRIAARYPDAHTIGMLDAGAGIDLRDSRIDWNLHPDFSTFEAYMADRAEQARSFHGVEDSALDESCKAANVGTGADEIDCFDGYTLQRDHLTTDMLQRTSLADSTTRSSLSNLIPQDLEETLRELTFDGLLASTAARTNLSALGANCTKHVTFRSTRSLQEMETLSLGPNTFRELTAYAFTCIDTGTCPKMVTVAPPLAPGASSCPPR